MEVTPVTWGSGRTVLGQRASDADDLLHPAGADVGLGVEAELFLRAEAGDVLIEAGARLARDIDPVLLAGEDRHLGGVDQEARAALGGRPVGIGQETDA